MTGIFAEGNDQGVIFVVNGDIGRQSIHKNLLQNIVMLSSVVWYCYFLVDILELQNFYCKIHILWIYQCVLVRFHIFSAKWTICVHGIFFSSFYEVDIALQNIFVKDNFQD